MQQISIIFIIISSFIAITTTFIAIGLSNIASFIFRSAIICIAKQKIKNSKAIFIGVTGSFGKTSVKEFLHHILSKKYIVASTPKNYNSDIGIALSVMRSLKKDTHFFIAEMGAYRIGEITKCCEFTQPVYGILTGIGNQHLDLFGSQTNLIRAKFELIKSLPEKGKAYIHIDSLPAEAFKIPLEAKRCYYSIQKKADVTASSIAYSDKRLHANIMYKKIRFDIYTKLLGTHNIANLLPCIALAHDLGVPKKDIEDAMRTLEPVQHRLSMSYGVNGSTILDDSYNSNVDGFIAAVRVADTLPFGKKIVITRGLIELGKEKKSSYMRIVKAIQASSSRITLYTTDTLFSSFDKKNCIAVFPTEDILMKRLTTEADKNTLIVLEGRFSPNTFFLIQSKL